MKHFLMLLVLCLFSGIIYADQNMPPSFDDYDSELLFTPCGFDVVINATVMVVSLKSAVEASILTCNIGFIDKQSNVATNMKMKNTKHLKKSMTWRICSLENSYYNLKPTKKRITYIEVRIRGVDSNYKS